MLNFVMLKCWNHSTTTRGYAVTYYKTLEEVPLHQEPKNLKKWQIFKNLKKVWKLVQNCGFIAIGCSSVATREGVWGECSGGMIGREGWAIVGWEQQRGGGVGATVGGGSTVGVSSTSKNRPSHHKFKSPKQFELKQSWKALRALNAHWAVPVYPVFRDEKSKASDKKLVKRKIA